MELDNSTATGLRYDEYAYVGPGTVAGRFLRRFWQPVYRSADLPPGRAVPLSILGDDFTLYRGEAPPPPSPSPVPETLDAYCVRAS
jgi:5,5'-dehydrodivanillate O-demethylase